MRRVMLVVVAALAVGVAPAGAHGWRLARAQQIANVVWNYPCGGHVRIEFVPEPSEDEALTRLGECLISVNSAQPPLAWRRFCRLVLHETGHVRGLPDSPDPRSVMFGIDFFTEDSPLFETVVRWVYRGRAYRVPSHDPRCDHRGVPYLRAHGAML